MRSCEVAINPDWNNLALRDVDKISSANACFASYSQPFDAMDKQEAAIRHPAMASAAVIFGR
jgi:hypothetical protein